MTDPARETAVSAAETDPAGIDLDKLCAEAGWLTPVERVLAAAVEALRERGAELKAKKWEVQHTDTMNDMVRLGLARDAAEARVTELERLDAGTYLHEIEHFIDRAEVAEAQVVELGGALEFFAQSAPVSGWMADKARTALDAIPVKALERARARDEVVESLKLVLEELETGLPDEDLAGVPEYENIWRAYKKSRAALDALDQEDAGT